MLVQETALGRVLWNHFRSDPGKINMKDPKIGLELLDRATGDLVPGELPVTLELGNQIVSFEGRALVCCDMDRCDHYKK
jgi:hypothetical protein